MNDMEAYGDGYMEPEEEWEREGLLDPAWEKQQKKVSESLPPLSRARHSRVRVDARRTRRADSDVSRTRGVHFFFVHFFPELGSYFKAAHTAEKWIGRL